MLAACGGDDDAASADVGAVAAESGDAGSESAGSPSTHGDDAGDVPARPGSELGIGEATVMFGDEVHRFALREATILDGQCRTLFDTLAIDLPLVESNGAEMPPGNGWLRMSIELEDVADFEPYVEMRVAGGHWYAGASDTAEISGVEPPGITLAGSGLTVSGTQSMVPLVAGPGEAIAATVELSCE